MTATAGQFSATLKSVHPAKLSAEDAETIIELAQMAVDADGQEDVDEIKTFFALGKAVYELAGLADAPTPTFIGDDDDLERIRELGAKLSSKESRELAYAAAHLLTVVDVQIAPEEDEFLEKLRSALGIAEDRADELAAQMSSAITPAE
ncbi:MAG TPA: hypothetical protein VL326_29225 [Kofleriaceae bacterium]|jgi:hypothetical protein|nr:hypothetical protein [Kofleriaceae bacterium]